MKETKAAFAKRTIRSLKKNTLPFYGGIWIQVHSQIVSIRYNPVFQKLFNRFDSKKVKKSEFMSILYRKPRREFIKSKFKIGDNVRNSMSSRSNIGHSFCKNFLKTLQFLPENLQKTQKKDEQDEFICGKYYEKELVYDK